MRLRVGTRGSALARLQARAVVESLNQEYPELTCELVTIVSDGDKIQDRSLAEIGGKSLFVKQSELALRENRIDIAVHSCKDIESVLQPDMRLGAVLPAAQPTDSLVVAKRFKSKVHSLRDLPFRAVLGTASPRRKALALFCRPDLQVRLLRGNVDSRLAKIDQGLYDAALLATAGLARLEMQHRGIVMPATEVAPAPTQGVIAIQWSQSNDSALRRLFAPINCELTMRRVRIERDVLVWLKGDCFTPISVFAWSSPDDRSRWNLRTVVWHPEGLNGYESHVSAVIENRSDEKNLAKRGADDLMVKLPEQLAEMLFTAVGYF